MSGLEAHGYFARGSRSAIECGLGHRHTGEPRRRRKRRFGYGLWVTSSERDAIARMLDGLSGWMSGCRGSPGEADAESWRRHR
jgi:hypothetical protein